MNKKQILVVEDETVVAEDIRKMLINYGYDVPEAVPSGDAAIKSINKNKPDLIILDIMLKDKISGIDVAKQISGMDIPVIYLTAYSDKEIIEKAKETNPFGYLIKPFRERELIATIKMTFFKHKMEQELKESEMRFRTLVETTKEGICILDLDNNFTFINKAGAKIFGSDISDFEGANLADYLSTSNLKKVMKQNDARKQNKSSRYELEIIRKNGRKRYLSIIGSPKFKDGKLAATFGIFYDITDKKLAQLQLKRTMDSYTRIFENIQDIYYEIEFDGTILEISPSIEHDTSYTREELIGKSLYKLFYNENQYDLFLTKLTKESMLNDYELIIRDKDHSPLTCSLNAKLIKEINSDKVRVIGSIKNITEQRESEAACNEYEKKYRTFFESSIDAVFLLDKNHKFSDFNNATLKLFGYKKRTDLLNLHPGDVSPKNQKINKSSLKLAEKNIEQTIKKGYMKFTWTHKKANGKNFLAEVWLNSLKLDGKTLIQGTIREIKK
ncbi:MAG: PAS domain S-box protein [Candidatus Cloacimonetes bacterium]|nr:PAS domain S-box protein [Candidatus Cloacimonadota bacterium]